MALTLRQLTSGKLAFSVWLMPDQTVRMVKLTQAQYDDFAITRKGVGVAPGRPAVDAVFLQAQGGIAALNTADGWPAVDDAWEVNDPEIGQRLVVCTGPGMNFEHFLKIASLPVNGRSQLSGLHVHSTGNRQVFDSYDVNQLDRLAVTETPTLTRDSISGSEPNHRSVTFGAQSFATIDGAALSLTLSHVVANQPYGYLAALSSSRAGQTLNSVTYNGDSLTSLLDVIQAAARAQHFFRVAPDIGTANIVFTFSANTDAVCGGISAYGVDQTSPHTDTDTQATTFGNNPTLTLTSAVGELGITNVCHTTGTDTPDASWTTAWNAASTGANPREGVAQYKAGAATITRTDSGLTATDCCMTGVSLKEATSKLLYLQNAATDGWQTLSELTQAAATLSPGGWIVSTGTTNHSEFEQGAERADSTFTGTTVPDGSLDTVLNDAFRAGPFNGYFNAGNWVVTAAMRAITNGGAHDGAIVVRVIRANADGTNATEMTSAQHTGATATDIGTAADVASAVTIALDGFAVENQYLFFQIAWKRIGAGGMTSSDVAFRTGSSPTEGTRITTPVFTAAAGSGAREFRNAFNEFDQRLTITTLPSTVVDNFTARAIVKMASTTLARSIWKNGIDSGGTNNGYGLVVDGTNPRFQILRDASGAITADANFSASTWYDVVIRRESGTLKLFINGAAQTGSDATAPTTPTAVFSLGARMQSATVIAQESDCIIAEFALWERAVSDADISTLCNSGTFKRSDMISTTNLVCLWKFGIGDTTETDEISSAQLTHTGFPLVQAGPAFAVTDNYLPPRVGSPGQSARLRR